MRNFLIGEVTSLSQDDDSRDGLFGCRRFRFGWVELGNPEQQATVDDICLIDGGLRASAH